MTPEQQKMVDSKLYTRQPEGEPPVRSSELVRMQWLFCAKCGQPYKTDKPHLTIGGKPMGLRRLCYDCELVALAGMLADETAS
jgi:hypothetical protein